MGSEKPGRQRPGFFWLQIAILIPDRLFVGVNAQLFQAGCQFFCPFLWAIGSNLFWLGDFFGSFN